VKTDASLYLINAALWLRVSVYACDEIADYQRLAEMVAGIIIEGLP
jgi:hypothetical protein